MLERWLSVSDENEIFTYHDETRTLLPIHDIDSHIIQVVEVKVNDLLVFATRDKRLVIKMDPTLTRGRVCGELPTLQQPHSASHPEGV